MPTRISQDQPEFLTIEENYACYRPVTEVTFAGGLSMVENAVRFCVENETRNLLLEVTGLTGFAPPTLAERYFGIEQLASIAAGKLKIAEVDREEQLDPSHANTLIAANRGLEFKVFTDESAAIEWLLE